jgi:hypothetical protein
MPAKVMRAPARGVSSGRDGLGMIGAACTTGVISGSGLHQHAVMGIHGNKMAKRQTNFTPRITDLIG